MHGRTHGPENAEYEIQKAYQAAIDTALLFGGPRAPLPEINAKEVDALYQKAFHCFRKDDRQAAERWARTTKHLARAFWHEARLGYLEAKATDLPYLTDSGAHSDDSPRSRETWATTDDLLNSLEHTLPPGYTTMPEEIRHYLARARKHLVKFTQAEPNHRGERAERLAAAHEYGRVAECLALALESEAQRNAVA